MPDWLNERDASERGFRLSSCAAARSLWHRMTRETVAAVERFADGELTDAHRRAAAAAPRATCPPRMTPDDPVTARSAGVGHAGPPSSTSRARQSVRNAVTDAARDQPPGGGGVTFFGSAAAFLFSAFRAAFSRLPDSIPRFVADDLAARAIRDPRFNRGRAGAYRPRGCRMPGHPGGVKGGGGGTVQAGFGVE